MDKILLVDDSEFFLMIMKVLLDRSGCNILTATNAKDAFELINKQKPQLILLDQNMPNIKGDEVCKRIKNNAETKNIPVIMVTASDQKDDMEKCFAAGCNDYMTKPVEKENLLDAINKYMYLAKRKYERAPIREIVKYYYNALEYSGHIHVISLGGAFIMGEIMLPPESIVKLKFSISNVHDSIDVNGKVVWNFDSKDNFPQLLATARGMGIEFIEISKEANEAISQYMAKGNFVI